LLIPPTLVALWIIGRDRAQWYVVPAVFPATQFYYVSLVLPAIVGRPVLAALLAMPVPLMTPAVVIGLAVRELLERRRERGLRAWSVGGGGRRPWRAQ
jgi:hypothetical protein